MWWGKLALRGSAFEKSEERNMTLVTFLVKSEKLRRICLGCLDENKKWIRPIKPDGFTERDIKMDNGY